MKVVDTQKSVDCWKEQPVEKNAVSFSFFPSFLSFLPFYFKY